MFLHLTKKSAELQFFNGYLISRAVDLDKLRLRLKGGEALEATEVADKGCSSDGLWHGTDQSWNQINKAILKDSLYSN